MTNRAHITQRNGSSRMVLVDDVRPYREQIRFTLNRMNGMTFWAWSLWRAPEGADLLASLPFSEDYLQCAGSADAMTIELRAQQPDGSAKQYTVGKGSGGGSGVLSEAIRWDDGRHSVKVHSNEVFTADEAMEVFYEYFQTGNVAGAYSLREVGGP